MASIIGATLRKAVLCSCALFRHNKRFYVSPHLQYQNEREEGPRQHGEKRRSLYKVVHNSMAVFSSSQCLLSHIFLFFFLAKIAAFPRIETPPLKFTIYFVHLWHLCRTALATLSFSHQLSLCRESHLLRSTTVKRTVTFLLNTVYKTSTRTPIKRKIRRPERFSLLRKGVVVAFVWQCFLHLHRIASHR